MASPEILALRDAARALLWAGDLAGARAAYDRALAAHPDEPVLLLGRAATGVKEDVDRALALDPKNPDALLARARALQDPRESLADAERALEVDPLHLPALYWRALWRAGFGEEEQAKADLRTVRDAAAVDLLSLQYRAYAAAALRDWKGACDFLDRVIAGGVGLYELRAEARARLKDAKGAAQDWTKALEQRPGQPSALVARSLQLRLAGFPADAMRDIEQALAIAPEHPLPLFHRAMARGGLNPMGARQDLEKAALGSVEDVEGYYHRGLAKEALGRGPSAIADYERALQLAPPFHPLREEIRSRAKPAVEPPRARGGPAPEGILQVAPVSVVLMALNIGIWLVQGSPYMNPDPETLLQRGAVWRGLVWQGEVWRLFTAMFLHIGALHLFWNAYAGFGICGAVERAVGSGRFLLAYVVSGLVGSAASVLGHNVVGAGASGALFGVVGLAIYSLYHRLGNLKLFFQDPRARSALFNIGIWFVLGLTILPMDNFAHGGGFVGGLVFGWLYFTAAAWSTPGRVTAWLIAMSILAAVVGFACIPPA